MSRRNKKKQKIKFRISSEKRRLFVHLAVMMVVIFFFTAISYMPVLKSEFTNWDDPDLVTNNSKIKCVSWDNILYIFSTRHIDLYHPFVLLTYMIEYYFFNLDPFFITSIIYYCIY